MGRKKKEEEKLKPEAIENNTIGVEIEELKSLASNINKFDFDIESSKEETFYKIAIEKLFDNKDIEQKTEFLNPAEVFASAKLQFLGDYGDIPLLSKFVTALEKKKVSLHRKGREEIILALQERRQEELEQRRNTLLGLNTQ